MPSYYRHNNQPHIQPIGATFSITILTHDAVPEPEIKALRDKRDRALHKIELDGAPDKDYRDSLMHALYENELEDLLNQKRQQEYPFKNYLAAEAFIQRVKQYHKQYYHLLALVVMANHVHLLLDFSVQLPLNHDGISMPKGYTKLGVVMNRIKGGGAYDVNRAIGREGPLWGKRYYDRYIRSAKHLHQAFWYILRNPVKAGLVEQWEEYPYTYAHPGLLEDLQWDRM